SMISIVRTTTGRVKNWHDGTMKKRWIAAGMLEAERSFRRVRGHNHMPALIAATNRATNPNVTPRDYAEVA
ncbi:MAG: IS256 family transposase, partial [Acidimicrobiales bacterium]